ncbi:MAG: Uma2 family endonuclease [Saprospiraceae bacterium]
MLFMWNYGSGRGQVHGPNGTFELPDGAVKMPDAAWISPAQLALTEEDNEDEYMSVVPDFVAEIRSKTDRLANLQQKMTESWMANGVKLAWLIDPYEEVVYVYQANMDITQLKGFEGKTLSGEPILPGFVLDLEVMRQKKRG